MNVIRRVFFDITYTRTQTGNVGITRTVRRLREELAQVLPSDVNLQCVAYHRTGFRAVDDLTTVRNDKSRSIEDTRAARLLRWISSSYARRLAFTWAPLPLLYLTWRVQSAWTFDSLTKKAPSIAFAKGDLLLLCDASWCCNAWQAAQVARKQGAKVVLLVYDLIPVTQPQYSSALTTRIFAKWLREMLAHCDAIICISNATEVELRVYAGKIGVTLPPTSHFRLGCDVVQTPVVKEIRKQISGFFEAKIPCFSSVGTIEPRKNYGMLLTAFEQLWEKGWDIRLLIIGRPNPDCHELLTRMKQHPEQGKRLLTIFDGTDNELEFVYSNCRALILPSLAEGFGLPLVEARTRGCTVIANNLPSFVELADNGVFFYRQNKTDELIDLIMENTRFKNRWTQKSLAPYTWHESAKLFIRKVTSLLKLDPISLKD